MPENNAERPTARARRFPLLAALATLALAAGGCGGGGGDKEKEKTDGKASTEETKTRTGPGPRPGPPPKPGTMIKDFNVEVASKTQAKITVTLVKPADLSLQVRRVAGDKPEKVGRVPLGQKPAGDVTINWNLRVANKPLTAGRYQLQLRGKGGAGKSLPKTITVP